MSGARRVLAVTRYLLADLLAEQRVLVPVLLFVAALGVLVSGDHTLAPGPWVASVLLLYPVTAWIGLTTANVEEPAQRAITTAAAGGSGRVTTATVLAGSVVGLVLVAVSVLLPFVVNPAGFPPASLGAAGLAHLAVAWSGLALGTVCARPLVDRVGWSFALITVVVLVTIGATWLPPVGVAAAILSAAGPADATTTIPALVAVATLAAVLLVAAATASWARSLRA